MGKKSAFALTLLLMISIVVTPIAFTNMANANFVFSPSNPDITFTSPVNTTYNTSDVSINVTIDSSLTGYSGGPNDERYTKLEYAIDGSSVFRPMIVVTKDFYYEVHGFSVQFNCSINLYSLREGNHTLTVKASFDYYYDSEHPSIFETESVANAYLFIDAVPDNTPTPTDSPIQSSQISPSQLVIIVLVVIAAVVVSISVYYLRIKR
jgi:hypothetical protein